ncbi:Multiple epidermal growth factor-like domains protein 8 [Podila verticillata]|nr:Multiple epidermal growth factor-like domains protein 8 [Podila verticillata]
MVPWFLQVPFAALLLHSLLSAYVHAQAGYTPFSAIGASSVMVEGKALYVQGGIANGQTTPFRQTFSIDLSGTWNVSRPPYTAMADGLDDHQYPGTLLKDGVTWFTIHRNKTSFNYNLATQTILPVGFIANYSSIEGLNAFVSPKTDNVVIPNGYWGQSGPFTTLSISPSSLVSQQLPSLPGKDGIRYYASAWSASENAYYVFGGWNLNYTGDLLRFDVTTNTWSNITAPNSPGARDVSCLASAYGGTKLVLYGGESPTGKFIYSEIHIFDVVKGTWYQGPDGETSRARAGFVCGVNNDEFVAWGGYTDMIARAAVQEMLSVYNLKTNTWQQKFNDAGSVGNGSGSGIGSGNGTESNPATPATSSGSNVGAIAGGVAAAVVILAAVAFFAYRRRKMADRGSSSFQLSKHSLDESSGFKDDSQAKTKMEEFERHTPSTKPRSPALMKEEPGVEGWGHQYPAKREFELDNEIEAQIEQLQTLMAQKNAMSGERSSPSGPQTVVYNTYGIPHDSQYGAPRGPQSSPPKIPQRPTFK